MTGGLRGGGKSRADANHKVPDYYQVDAWIRCPVSAPSPVQVICEKSAGGPLSLGPPFLVAMANAMKVRRDLERIGCSE